MWGRLRMHQQWDKVMGDGETEDLNALFELGLRKGSLSGTLAAHQLTSVTHTSPIKSISLIHGSFFPSFLYNGLFLKSKR